MKNRKTQFKFFIAGILTIILLSVLGNTYYSKKEYKEGLAFKVSKVKSTPALRLNIYDGQGKELDLQQFVFYSREDVKAGDSIAKMPNSNIITVYRKDKYGDWKVYLTKTLD